MTTLPQPVARRRTFAIISHPDAGKTTLTEKLLLFGGAIQLAGAVKAIVFQLASLTDVHWTMSGEVVLMTLLGGMGTIFGPVVGAFIIIALESYLAAFGEWVTVITGAIFVVCVLAFRRGIVGELAAWWDRKRG